MSKFKAFTVLEAAFAILLIGIFTSILFPYYRALRFQEDIIITRLKANYIRKALEGYVIRHGFLPYAADVDGLEKNDKVRGLVPYRTLGIRKYYVYDAAGRNFSYIVNEHLSVKEQGELIMPATMPLNIPPVGTAVRFCRIYQYYNDNGEAVSKNTHRLSISDDDQFFSKGLNKKLINNLIVESQGKSIINTQNNYFPFIYDRDYGKSDCKDLLVNTRPQHRVLNVIAWVLISHSRRKNAVSEQNLVNEHSIFTDGADLVFWQSRFNLAAQIKHPCSRAQMHNTVDQNRS